MTDRDRAQLDTWKRIAVDLLGGWSILDAANQHFGDGVSLRRLADWLDLPEATLRGRLNRVREAFAKHGVTPAGWSKPRPGRPGKPTIVATGGDLHQLRGNPAQSG
jgi:hypothetical protein